MIRELAVLAGLAAAGAGAWALSLAPPGSIDDIRSLVEDRPATDAATDYPIRLELPQARQLASDARSDREIALADLATPAEPSAALVTASVEQGLAANPTIAPRSGLLDMDFDIATFGKVAPASGGRTIRTTKSLNHGGNRVGSVDLALGHGSVVSVDRQALQTLVAGKDETIAAALAGMEGELVSFDALRDRGIRIRYDPLADAVVIDGGA